MKDSGLTFRMKHHMIIFSHPKVSFGANIDTQKKCSQGSKVVSFRGEINIVSFRS